MTWTPEQTAEVVQLFRDGMTQTAIAARVGRTLKAVNSKLKRAGVVTSSTKCPNGHPWEDVAAFTARGQRYCKLCHSLRVARAAAKAKLQRIACAKVLATCRNGHEWVLFEAFKADGKRYCKACYRSRKGLKAEAVAPTTCRQGHPWTEENTYYQHGSKRCRACRREIDRRWRERKPPEWHEARAAAQRVAVKKPQSTWATPEALELARTLYAQGLTQAQVADRIGNGCTMSAVKGMISRHGWQRPKRAPKPKAERRGPRGLGYSAEQKALLRELWPGQQTVTEIHEQLNKLGPFQFTVRQVCDLAKRMGLHRSRSFLQAQARQRGHMRWGTKPRPGATTAAKSLHIPIPLREVWRRAAELGIPRSKRGDIGALNRAVKREKPDHPGYTLADYRPSRLQWAI